MAVPKNGLVIVNARAVDKPEVVQKRASRRSEREQHSVKTAFPPSGLLARLEGQQRLQDSSLIGSLPTHKAHQRGPRWVW